MRTICFESMIFRITGLNNLCNLNLELQVVAIMDLFGACRSDELYKLEISNVDDRKSAMFVALVDAKTENDRSFCIADKKCGKSVLEIVREYGNIYEINMHRKYLMRC